MAEHINPEMNKEAFNCAILLRNKFGVMHMDMKKDMLK